MADFLRGGVRSAHRPPRGAQGCACTGKLCAIGKSVRERPVPTTPLAGACRPRFLMDIDGPKSASVSLAGGYAHRLLALIVLLCTPLACARILFLCAPRVGGLCRGVRTPDFHPTPLRPRTRCGTDPSSTHLPASRMIPCRLLGASPKGTPLSDAPYQLIGDEFSLETPYTQPGRRTRPNSPGAPTQTTTSARDPPSG